MKNKPKYTAALIFLVLLLMVAQSGAFTITDASYKIKGEITTGGNSLSSDTYKATLSIGQPVIGIIESANNEICYGIFCQGIFNPMYTVTVDGNIKYLTGDAVADSKITGSINSIFKSSTYTDQSGNYRLVIEIPEEIYDSDFTVQIYAEGKVNAVYECIYSTTDKSCS